MINRHAVAPLRPRPSGPPLRGRATLRNGMTAVRPQGLHEHGTGDRRFHLRIADPWSKIGGRRRGSGVAGKVNKVKKVSPGTDTPILILAPI